MSMGRVFHKHLDKVFRVFSSKVFHSCICVFIFCVFAVVTCDANVPVNEEYILKATKVIEAVPRALHRQHNDGDSTALSVEAKSSDPCGDRLSYDAIKTLHRQLDDDASGDIDIDESDEFLRDELKYENGYERHKEFHGDDKSISVDELWNAWKISQVHNWTVDETVDWLISSVELPDYEHSFRNNAVDGSCLPRLAINSNSFLSGKLGIKDPIHRQKIALKAMDNVLFGPPRRHNYLKDAILAVSLVVATGGVWFAYVQHKSSQSQMQKMMKDMELLQRAEDALREMQQELTKARQEQEIVNIEKQDLERRLQDEMKTSYKGQGKGQPPGSTDVRLRELEEQLRTARSSLHDAERRLGARAWVAPPNLQLWLQLTYELELKSYNKKKAVAEQQLQSAKEGCEKLKKKRSTFMGAFRITHGGSIDDVDDRIIQAKTALSEVTTDLQERMHRWKQIEKFCGVPIMQNPGISCIESILRPPVVNGSAGTLHSGALSVAHSSSEGNLSREESPPPYAAGLSAALLSNIPPPPTYSRSSPSYSRKPNVTAPDSSYYSAAHSTSGFSVAHCTSSSGHDVLAEVAGEDDDQILEADEDILEENPSHRSCPSFTGYFDAGRPALLLEDSLDEVGSGGAAAAVTTSLHTTESGSRDLLQTEQDTLSSHSESLASESIAASENGETISARKISMSTHSEKKKKSSGGFVSALKNSFSSSNLSSFDTCDDDDATVASVDSKPKKKKLFARFMHKKSKLM